MAVSLVTGFAGKAHITSLDTARFNAGVVGKGDYVFAGVGDNKLKATMASSNKVHIASGNGMMQGRHFVVDAAGVDLTVQTGTQGQKRNDLVVARYAKNSSTGVEAVDLAVIKGTPTTGTPADPACTKGDILNGTALTADMPLWRIPLNGITVGAPVQMFSEISSAKDAWDSVSHGTSGGWDVVRIGKFAIVKTTTRLQSNAVIDNAWGVLHESDAFALPDYPVKFASYPWSDVIYVDADPGYRNAAFIERTPDSMSWSNPGTIYFVRPDSTSTIGHPLVSIVAAGLTA